MRVIVDSEKFKTKPITTHNGIITNRLKETLPINADFKEIVSFIENGQTIRPAILTFGSAKADDFEEQELFFVDIDNSKQDRKLEFQDILNISNKRKLPCCIIYESFSSKPTQKKYRVIFRFEKVVKDLGLRNIIINILYGLYLQADDATKNTNRYYFGTNKKISYLDKKAVITMENIIDNFRPEIKKYDDAELEKIKKDFDFLQYLICENGQPNHQGSNYLMFPKCPICGHHNCFVYYLDTKSFYCFGANGGVGGSIFDYIMITKKLEFKEAVDYVKCNILNLPKSERKLENNQELKLNTISAKDLIAKDLPSLKWSVDNLIVQGLTVLASPPKYGKSWLALDLCYCVSTGKDFLGYKTNTSRVLYLALEDGYSRLQERLKKICENTSLSENFDISIKSLTLANGFINQVEEYIKQYPSTSLIVVDTLQKIRGIQRKNEGAYAYDYRELGALKTLADKHSISILLIHHLRKMKDDDVFNQISGTNGLSGTADTMMVLSKDKRIEAESILHITGRDVEYNELIIKFDKSSCKWSKIGNYEEEAKKREIYAYQKNKLVLIIKKLLKDKMEIELSASEIKQYCFSQFNCNLHPISISKQLKKLKDEFLEYDNIEYIAPPINGKGGKRMHKFMHIK